MPLINLQATISKSYGMMKSQLLGRKTSKLRVSSPAVGHSPRSFTKGSNVKNIYARERNQLITKHLENA